MPPTSVMTIETTAAKIGRSMKKCENLIARHWAASAFGGRRHHLDLDLGCRAVPRTRPLMMIVSSPVRPSRITR